MIAPDLSRRVFLKASGAAGGGLLLAAVVDNAAAALLGAANIGAGEFVLNAWLRIGIDNRVTVLCSQSEMGQGVMTTLPALVAEELGADWRRVRVEFSPVAAEYRNPRLDWMFTGNSESATAFFDLLRRMGASAREMLIAAAAERWKVEPGACSAENSRVTHAPTRRGLSFGQLAEAAARRTPPVTSRLKSEGEWKLVGRSLPRLDLPGKIDGSAAFGLDVKIDRMLYAAVRQSPVFGGEVRSVDRTSIANLSGVVDVVAIPNGVAVVARSYWEAQRALRALSVDFEDGPNKDVDSASLARQYREALDGERWRTVHAIGRFEDPAHRLEIANGNLHTADYESQFLAHATMEPMNCTAHWTENECRVWGPLQGAELAQVVVGQVTGLPKEKIAIERTLLGGGFGRRLLADFVVPAVLASKAVAAPVKAIWSREEDMQHDVYRPATLHRIAATIGDDGLPTAIVHRLVSPSILQFVYPPGVTADNDPSCLEGLLESHYRIPDAKVEFHLLKVGVPTSVLRTTGFGPNLFAMESFVDELAHRAGKDPYLFRRALLTNDRARAVLDLAAEKSGWTTAPPPGVARGIACAEAFRTHIAHVVELSITAESTVKIHRVICAADCGTTLDPGITTSSLEGGTVWGLGVAFKSAISFKNGRAVERNWHDYRIVQMDETPPIEVYTIESGARPLGGTGEVGPVTVVPAIANALFAATGRRVRSLPVGFALA